jgi:hypothetical protein
MRKYQWIVEVIKQRPVGILHPYMVEVYVAVDGSEACLSLAASKTFCAPKRRSEGGVAGADLQQVRSI